MFLVTRYDGPEIPFKILLKYIIFLRFYTLIWNFFLLNDITETLEGEVVSDSETPLKNCVPAPPEPRGCANMEVSRKHLSTYHSVKGITTVNPKFIRKSVLKISFKKGFA